jgi:hypothetical protein
MKISIVVTLFIFVVSVCAAQKKVLKELATDNEWSEGSLLTSDGTELKGLLKFDDRVGIIHYINGDESHSFTPKRVAAFEFFDSVKQKQRLFYSLEYEYPLNDSKQPVFFEVLKDFKTYAVMSKLDPIRFEQKGGGTTYAPAPGGRTMYSGYSQPTAVASQTETIYFLSEDGSIEPYIQVIRKVANRERKTNKFVDRDVIEKYFTADELESMRAFAEEKDLDFRVKDDFITILDFAVTIRNK